MKILVTGATGFLGRYLTTELEKASHEVTRVSSKNADLTRAESLDQFNATKFDRIYHLAAWTQAGDFCLHHPGEQWVINQKINTNVLGWWAQSQRQAKLIAMGTSCSYDPTQPLVEGNYLAGTPIESLFTYAHSKRMLLVGLMALQKQYGLKWLCLVPSTLYGSGYHTDGRQLHFIFDLIRKIIQGHDKGTPVELWGDGYQKRELVLVNDFVRAMLALDAAGVENRLLNIGAGEEFTIRQFASNICEFVGYDPKKIQYDTSKDVGAKSKCLDISELKRILPQHRNTPLAEGLKSTVEWFLANKHHFNK